MLRACLQFLGLVGGTLLAAAADSTPIDVAQPARGESLKSAEELRIYVIPVREQIGSAVHYVVRRGLKEAIAQHADAVVLDMKTPGGALDTTLEIMEALRKFPGTTATYV